MSGVGGVVAGREVGWDVEEREEIEIDWLIDLGGRKEAGNGWVLEV